MRTFHSCQFLTDSSALPEITGGGFGGCFRAGGNEEVERLRFTQSRYMGFGVILMIWLSRMLAFANP